MLPFFKNFSRQYPKLARVADGAASFSLVSGMLYGTLRITEYSTDKEEDPNRRAIVWNNFLDVDSCRQALAAYDRAKARERPR